MTAGFVHLPEDSQKSRINLWATIARDEPAIPTRDHPGAPEPVAAEPGVRVIPADQVADWLRTHGGGFPRG